MLDILTGQLSSIGGPVLIVLGLLSVFATATAVYKILQFIQLGVGRHKGAHAALERWGAGDREGAARAADDSPHALMQVLSATMASLVSRPHDRERAMEIGTQAAIERLTALGRYMRVLESVVQAAPMLGLLGTVIGMIDAFGQLSQAGGAVDPALLAGGIWIALTTTAVGLAIAIPFYFVSMWLEGLIERERAAMESAIALTVHGSAGGGHRHGADEQRAAAS